MKNIKFRAFDKKTKKIFPVSALHSNGAVHIDVYPDSKAEYKNADEVEVMQFTGLLDKNGKEIWEGDLFACIYKFDGHKDHIYEVYYDEMHGRFSLQRHGNQCPQYGVIKELIDVARYPKLGNIYENPELLK